MFRKLFGWRDTCKVKEHFGGTPSSTAVLFSMGGVVKVDIYEVDSKIELYVDTFLLGL